MKLTSDQIALIAESVDQKRREKRLTLSDLAARSGVHQSQISRILAKKFKTISANIMQICIALDLPLPTHLSVSDFDRKRISDSAISVWNGTRDDADALVQLLSQIAKLRR